MTTIADNKTDEAATETVNDVDQTILIDQLNRQLDRTKQIKVLLSDDVLFEGLSGDTKQTLKGAYGDDIVVYYQQTYTTVKPGQTYIAALEDSTNMSLVCYTEAEFVAAATKQNVELSLWAYNQKDLDKRQGVKKTKISPKVKGLVSNANMSLFLFTSLADLNGDEFPIAGLTKEQVTAAKASLEEEDFALSTYATENNLSINDKQVKDQQIEACIFLSGYPTSLQSYITMTGVKWVGSAERKGLIKNTVNNVTGQQVILLIIDVRVKNNANILNHLGY